jgi:hypothetical protein
VAGRAGAKAAAGVLCLLHPAARPRVAPALARPPSLTSTRLRPPPPLRSLQQQKGGAKERAQALLNFKFRVLQLLEDFSRRWARLPLGMPLGARLPQPALSNTCAAL